MNQQTFGYKAVFGLTGPIASGKGLVVKAIKTQLGNVPLRSVLLSDYIRDAVRSQNKPITRDTLREAGNAERERIGSGAWVEHMLMEIPTNDSGVLIVDSIRNPGEIEMLRTQFQDRLFVIATDAPLSDRIARTISRGREDDSEDPFEIERQMRIEMEDNPISGFAIERCRAMADAVSLGTESKEARMRDVERIVGEFWERMEQFEKDQARKNELTGKQVKK